MKVHEIITALEAVENKDFPLQFTDTEKGVAYKPLIIQNNEIKTLMNESQIRPERGYLIPIITLQQFIDHLKENVGPNNIVLVDAFRDETYSISGYESGDKPDEQYFEFTKYY